MYTRQPLPTRLFLKKSRTQQNMTVQSRSENALGSANRQKEILDLSPARNPTKTGDGRIMRSGEEDSLAFESLQMPVGVVNQVVGVQDALVAAENEVGRRDEGKVAS